MAAVVVAILVLSLAPAARADDRPPLDAVVYDTVQCVKFLDCDFEHTLHCVVDALKCSNAAVCSNLPDEPYVSACEG